MTGKWNRKSKYRDVPILLHHLTSQLLSNEIYHNIIPNCIPGEEYELTPNSQGAHVEIPGELILRTPN